MTPCVSQPRQWPHTYTQCCSFAKSSGIQRDLLSVFQSCYSAAWPKQVPLSKGHVNHFEKLSSKFLVLTSSTSSRGKVVSTKSVFAVFLEGYGKALGIKWNVLLITQLAWMTTVWKVNFEYFTGEIESIEDEKLFCQCLWESGDLIVILHIYIYIYEKGWLSLSEKLENT
jgi:hypothetical protein